MTETFHLSELVKNAHEQALSERYIPAELEVQILTLAQTAKQTNQIEQLRAEFNPLLRKYGMALETTKNQETPLTIDQLTAIFLVSGLLIQLGLLSELYPNADKTQQGYLQTLREHRNRDRFLDAAGGQSAFSTNLIWRVITRELVTAQE